MGFGPRVLWHAGVFGICRACRPNPVRSHRPQHWHGGLHANMFAETIPMNFKKMFSSQDFFFCQSFVNCQVQDDDFKYRGKREVEALPKFNEVKNLLGGDVEVPGKQGKETKPSVFNGHPKFRNMSHCICISGLGPLCQSSADKTNLRHVPTCWFPMICHNLHSKQGSCKKRHLAKKGMLLCNSQPTTDKFQNLQDQQINLI